jgi:dTDP-4-amino-4,6-dideoxygalactose transaminase
MVPFLDLGAQYRSIKSEIDAAVARVFESSQFILGREVAAFEEEFSAWCGVRHTICVNSGTSALHIALLAAGVGPGDEVITTPFTFVATVAAIHWVGARPVYVDIEPRALQMDVAQLERAITPATKAILPVHLFGHPVDMDPLLEIAARRGLIVIEDAAQAHGAEYKGRRAGTMSELACFSFYPGKNLGAYGEGGCVVTSDDEFARTLRLLRDWGCEQRYYHKLRGFNYRMEGLQGAMLRVKLKYLDRWVEARRAHAAAYQRLLAGSGIATPVELSWARHVYNVFAVRLPNRDQMHAELAAAGVHTGIHYPIPIHLQEAWRDERYGPGDLPLAEQAAREVLSLPIYPELTPAQIDEAASAVRRCSSLATSVRSRTGS